MWHRYTLLPPRKPAGACLAADTAYVAVAQLWHLPIEEASRQLCVGVTNLKKVCRELGIRKWPSRKLRSMDSLIAVIEQQLAVGGGHEVSVPVGAHWCDRW